MDTQLRVAMKDPCMMVKHQILQVNPSMEIVSSTSPVPAGRKDRIVITGPVNRHLDLILGTVP